MGIEIEIFLDETGYPKDIFLYDNKGEIASYFKPLRVSIVELESLFDKLAPLIKAYKQWSKEHEAIMYGEAPGSPGTVIPHGRL